MEFGSSSFKQAMDALNAEVKRLVVEPGYQPQLPETLRSELIAFADRNIDARAQDREGLARLQVQRLAARNIAGSLAMIDGPDGRAPFAHQELSDIYRAEQAYRATLEQTLQRQSGRGMDR
jgi:hypothetical protein